MRCGRPQLQQVAGGRVFADFCTADAREVAPHSGQATSATRGVRRASDQSQQVSKKRNVKAKPSVQAKSLLLIHREPFSNEDDDIEAAPHPSEPLSVDDPLAPLPFNPYKGNRGLTRAWHAMKNSLNGFRVAIREESAFRQELTLAAILVPCGIFVPVSPVERAALLASVLLVLMVELLNSSVEAAIDRISLERHELSKRAKDFGSAAVMVALLVCVLTWGLIVGPLLWRWALMLF
jgi:diacylglycerol kinase (ATP)